ncbi:unnamed protein product [Darwinula stevensoni]|uniref:Uncharacterized protein n=1 Tax=Darwinula stevensoni TaxID=69355 RepID=A0A7R8WZ25_9CRUS|nr:unnamed protein product [Darwinula stevensoni]CAG0879708.1 unnamed protein product [Darwinula stevensoni]
MHKNLSPSELKKRRNKEKKEKKLAAQKAAAAASKQDRRPQQNHEGGTGDADKPKQDDLDPQKLASDFFSPLKTKLLDLQGEDPLSQAVKFLIPLQQLSPNQMNTHTLAFEIFFRKKKPLLMLQSLKRGYRMDPNHPGLHSCLIRFCQLAKEQMETWPEPMQHVVSKETEFIFCGKSAHDLNEEFIKTHHNSLSHLIEGQERILNGQEIARISAKMLFHLDRSQHSRAWKMVTSLQTEGLQNITLPNCERILEEMKVGSFGKCDPEELRTFSEQCNQLFPLSEAFRLSSPTPVTVNHVDENCIHENCIDSSPLS